MKYLYSLILLFTISYPLLKSFENRIQFYKKWRFLFPGILISAFLFIAWDVWFTSIGVWRFNPNSVLGFYIFNLPVEEWLFFLCVPFSCAFIYEVLNYFVKKDIFQNQWKLVSYILIALSFIFIIIYYDRLYTFVVFLLLAVFLLLLVLVIKPNYMGRFYLSWLVCIIPFLLVNGLLTGYVLIYNDAENMQIRLYTIPIEDMFYGMLQFLLVITLYEKFKKKTK